ncbi:phosphatase PAP2 family protein [Pedobacter sp. SD-b]|uniref:Phosphatase PAP2 family protein n=1 Tax=Pedobacter segetis TaxID=2793069 RepID=A0ABS1BFX9_9SPHI|nr:phosphatase PAP2 family protein [Pedobacter segetis]MBK0381770.1 phosphatase PAP2 family protein [Pedobacter segetis]
MLEALLKLDHHIFHTINYGMGNAFFDWLMPLIREKKNWTPLYAFILIYFIYNYRLKGFYFILFFAAAVGLADFLSAGIIKPLVNRDRPCQEASYKQEVVLRVGCGTGKSFPSSHATDHFAMAIFMITVFYKRWRWIIYTGILWAGAISFAQVYVGVHFPIDVFIGMLIGSLIGFLMGKLCVKVLPIFDHQ